MQCLVENLPNVEAIRHEVDNLPFSDAGRVLPPDVGDAEVTSISIIAHICIDQVMARVAFIHFPGRFSVGSWLHFLVFGNE